MARKAATTAAPKTGRINTSRKETVDSTVPAFSFGLCNDGSLPHSLLLIMPGAEPRRADLSEAFRCEIQLVYGDSVQIHTAMVERFLEAQDQGRVLWGWSPWRAKEDCLTWEKWDKFCARWLSLCTNGGARPECYGLDKSLSVRTLCREVFVLVESKKVRLLSGWPQGFHPAGS